MGRPRMPMGGMGNMNSMIKQAQKMQQTDFEASAGGGMVSVTVTGKKEIKAISINPEAVDPDDVEMLQDLILVAVNDALKKVDDANAQKMGALTGGLNIPGMF